MSANTVPDVLDAAADYLAEHGWCAHRSTGPLGEVCIMEAVQRVGGTLLYDRTWDALKRRVGDPVDWNDYDVSCGTDAQSTLREIANELRGTQ